MGIWGHHSICRKRAAGILSAGIGMLMVLAGSFPLRAFAAFPVADLPQPLALLPRASADFNITDGELSSPEFNEVIALWQAGAYRINSETDHGYQPGTESGEGVRHSADVEAPFWSITLPEIVREGALRQSKDYRQALTSSGPRFLPNWPYRYAVDSALTASASVHYVNAASTNPTPPFTSEATAATTIQAAVDVAGDHAVILVWPGSYDSGIVSHTAGAARVVVEKPVSIVSVGGPVATSIRGATNPVVRGIILNHPQAILRGFTVRDGAAGGLSATNLQQRAGGGLLGLAFREISDVIAVNNTALPFGSGGGIALMHSQSSRVMRCSIRHNRAGYGGGMAVYWGNNVEIDAITVISNSANHSGGGLLIDNIRRVQSALIAWNQAGFAGGGVAFGNFADLWHGIVRNNTAPSAGGVLFGGDQSRLINSIINENPGGGIGVTAGKIGNSIGFSLLDDLLPPSVSATNMVTGIPQYLNAGIGDYRLHAVSPGVGAATNVPWLAGRQDLAGLPRVIAGTPPDLGAYTFAPLPIVLEPAGPYLRGQPLPVVITGAYPAGDVPGSVGIRLNLPADWSIQAATSQTAEVYYRADELLLAVSPTATHLHVDIMLTTSAALLSDPVVIPAELFWQHAGMLDVAATDGAQLLVTNHLNGVWFAVEAVAESEGLVEPSWQAVDPLGQATVAVVAAAFHEIDRVDIAGAEVPEARGQTSYLLTLGPVEADVLVRAYFRPQRTTQGVPFSWLADQGLTNDPPEIAALTDYDGDGFAAWEEYIAGTSPLDPASFFVLDWSEKTPGAMFDLEWPSVTGRLYTLYQSHDLTAGVWSVLASNVPATPPRNLFTYEIQHPLNAIRIRVTMDPVP